MNNILEFLIKNKEWLFSGIGVAIIIGLLSQFKKFFNKKKKGLTTNGPKEAIINNAELPLSFNKKSELFKNLKHIISPESLSPNEIYKDIKSVPLLQQQELIKHYIGIKVIWDGKLFDINRIDDNVVRIGLDCNEKIIFFKVNEKDYSGLGLLKTETLMKVEGIIEEIRDYIDLKEAKIISIIPPE